LGLDSSYVIGLDWQQLLATFCDQDEWRYNMPPKTNTYILFTTQHYV